MELKAFCAYPFNRVRVTCEGHVAMCCFQRPDPAGPADPYIGNLLESSFDDVWFGEVAEQIRQDTLAGELSPRCRVPGCPFSRAKPPYTQKRVVYNEYPNFLEIDLPNTHCNVGGETPGPANPACIMCERAGGPDVFRPETSRLPEVLGKLVYLVPNLYQIHIQGIAEPFYKDLIFDVLSALGYSRYRKDILVSTTTNGTLLKRPVRARYLNEVPHSITNFSLDAATPETFRRIRIFDCFDKVLANLYAFAAERDRSRQFLRIQNNINLLNVDEVVGMVEIAARAGVNLVEFNPTDGWNREILVNQSNCGRFLRAQEDIVEACQRLHVPYSFMRPLDLGMTQNMLDAAL